MKRFTAAAALALVYSLALAAVCVNVARSHALYEYDRVTYWFQAARVGDGLFQEPMAILGVLNGTLRTADYNYLPAILPGLAAAAFGNGRAVFVGSLAVFYLSPLLVVLAWLGRRAVGRGAAWVVLPWAVSPAVWSPVRDGYPDVGGLALGIAAAALILRPGARGRLRRWAAAGALLALMVLFRRWLLYWAVALTAAAVLTAALRVRRGGSGLMAVEAARAGGVIGGVGFALACLLAWPMPVHMLTTDYAAQYAAYRGDAGWAGTTARSVAEIARSVGLVPLSLAVVALAVCLADPRCRRPVMMIVGPSVLAFLLFNHTQALAADGHHTYLVLPALLWPLGVWLARTERSIAWQRAKAVGVTAILLTDAALALVPGPRAGLLLSGVRLGVEWRDDLPEVNRLLDDLGRHSAVSGGAVYVLSASTTLNYTQFKAAELSLGRPVAVAGRTWQSAEVDLRDGLPRGLLFAKYVVVADPVQVSLRPSDQRVVTVPAAAMLGGGPFAAAFTKWPARYALENGVTAYVFERDRPSTNAEADTILHALQAAYPGVGLFDPPQ